MTTTAQAPYGQLPRGGAVRPITRWGEPIMHRPQQRVESYDEQLRSLAADMVETMYAADGVGLAACQIGVDLAMFVFDCPDDNGSRTVGVVCNPVVSLPEGKDRRLDEADEGCLSYPGAYVECARPDTATVTGTGLDGEPVSFSGDGLLARCLQHETDHTNGTVFGDRVPTKQRKRLQKAMERVAEDFPADVADLRIVQLSADALAALAEGDLATADALSPVPLSPWLVSDEAIGTWRRRAAQVVETPADLAWVTGVLVDGRGVVVGKAGFHAAPDEDGMVEVGYAVDPAHRRRGYARAALEAMIGRARADPAVRVLRATVSPDNAASLGLVAQYPFVEVGEQWDDEDGLETIFELDVGS